MTPTVRELTETESEYWNSEVQRFDVCHPLNAFEWAQVRSVDGWVPIYLCAERDGRFCGGLMILKKRLPCTRLTVLYGQKMPVWNYEDDSTLAALVNAAIAVGKRENAILLRINPNIPEAALQGQKDKFVELGFRHLEQRWSFWNSPRDVARVDLTTFESPQLYFEHLPKNTRAGTRKARREGLAVEAARSKTELRQFYEMFKQFSIERGFMVRDYAYQEKLWETYLERGMGRLLVAKYQGKVVGGSLDLLFAGKCLGMHGGSLLAYRKLAVDDSCNAEAIMWAKEKGCRWYSFRGLGSTASQGAYKRKFMANVVSLVGYYDFPLRPLFYKLFYWAEFTLLPASWPAIIRIRKLADLVRKWVTRPTPESP